MNTLPAVQVWRHDPGKKFCVLLALNDVPRDYEISKGISRARGFPADANFCMDKQFKKQVALSDNLANLDRMPVVSQRLREFIESSGALNVEFLKVRVIDHKNKPIEEPYYIANPLTVVDCIDTQRSKLFWNDIDPELIATMFKMELRPDNIDPGLLMFRPKHMEGSIFVRGDFADKVKVGGFTGVAFTEASKFAG